MTNEPPADRHGRPPVGPAVSVDYPEDLLGQIDKAANREKISRAEWLRGAARRSLPHDTLRHRMFMERALSEADNQLSGLRETALDAGISRPERESRGVAYSESLRHLRHALRQALEALPVAEAAEAYETAYYTDPTETPEFAALWGQALGLNLAAQILDAALLTLPVDGERVRGRAGLDDPLADLG